MSSLSETLKPQQNGSRNYLKEWSDCRRNLIPSGQSKVFSNRVGWAKTYLKNAGLVDSRSTIQSFVGSMDMIRAKKGVVITTSDYSRDAIDFVDRIEVKRVVLINGKQLAQLMIEHDVGVSTIGTCSLKEVSNDFFEEDLG